MKVTCRGEHLKNAVLVAERFIGRNATLPILSHLLFTTRERKVFITATNLEVGIEYAIPGKVEVNGAITTPAKTLAQILQSLHSETITITGVKSTVTLHTPSSVITLASLLPEDFPTLPTIQQEQSFSIPSEIFHSFLGRVLPAAATSDLKPELSGVFFCLEKGQATIAATDSFRLAEGSFKTLNEISERVACIIPSRTLQELSRVLSFDAPLTLHLGEHQIVFQQNDVRILSRLVGGAYPPYKNLIPKSSETNIVVKRDELTQKVRLASVFSSRLQDVTLKFSANELEVTTAHSEGGSTTSEIAAKIRGKSGAAAFNYRYLLDGLEAAGGEHILLNVNGASGPTMIQNPSDGSFLYLVMPIRSV